MLAGEVRRLPLLLGSTQVGSSLLSNIRLGCKHLTETNNLALLKIRYFTKQFYIALGLRAAYPLVGQAREVYPATKLIYFLGKSWVGVLNLRP